MDYLILYDEDLEPNGGKRKGLTSLKHFLFVAEVRDKL